MTEEGKRACRAAYSLDLSTRVVLRDQSQLIQVNVVCKKSILFHLSCMDFENLQASIFIRQTDLKVQLKTSGSEHRLVNHINPISHSDDKDIV